MRYLTLLLLPLLLPFALDAQIWTEDFDGSNTTNPPMWSAPVLPCGDNNDYFAIVCTPATGCPIQVMPGGGNVGMEYFGSTGQFFGARDMDSTPCGSGVSLDETLSFTGINISSSPPATVLYICFDVAESRNNDPNGDGDFSDGAEWGSTNMREDTWDGNSYLHLDASVDGAPFSRVTAISNFTENGSSSDKRPGIDVNCNGQGNDPGEPELTDFFTTYCFELPTSGLSLDINFDVGGLNGGGEDIAIDNIEVYSGSTPAGGTLLEACTPFEASNPNCNDMTLWRENFDGSNATNPPILPNCDATPSRDYLGIVCNNGAGCPNEINADYLYFGASGQYFGVRDMDNVCGGSIDEVLSFTGIDISGCSGATNSLYLCVDLAESQPNNGREMTGNPPIEDSWDGNSNVNFKVSIDGCPFEEVTALESSSGTNSRPGIDTDCGGGSAGDDNLLSDNFTTFCFELTQLGATLDLDIQVIGLNTDGEDIAIDNIELVCSDLPGCLPALPTIACTVAEPLAANCPPDVTVNCDESTDPANTGMATAPDACPVPTVITYDDVSTQGQGCSEYSYIIIRTWTATDAAGETATCSQIITVQDVDPPTITCPTDITVDCADPTDPGFTGYATASGDNCAADDELTVTFMDVSSQTPTGTGCSNDNYTITRTWTASDPCGNTSQCVQVITVQDTEAPVIICPPEVTIECDEPLVTLPVMGTTTASAPTNSVSWPNSGAGSTGLVGSVPVNISGIPAGAEVTDVNIHIDMDQSWVGDLNLTLESPDGTTVNFVDDLECGDTNSGSQDNISATFDSDAAGFSCGLSSNDVGDPDDCSNDYLAASAVSGTVQPQLGSFDVFDGTSAAGDWILSITDEAEGDGGCLINFTVEVSWTVAGGGMTGIPVAVDNCSAVGSIALDISDVTTQTASGCGQYEYVITRTWTATDACGNSSTCVQTINVEDTTAPDIVCPPTVNLDCNDSTDPSNTGMATAGADNCASANEVIVTFTDVSTQTGSGCGADTYTITRTWAATDACGNSSTCVQVINVADTTPPDITCPPDQTLTCFESLPDPISTAADFVAAGGTISDDCTANLSDFTVFAVADDNDGTNCPGDARIVVRTYFVLDACGNTTTCDQTFTYLESTMGPVITDVLPECYKYCASLANPMETDITYETDCSFGATVEITGPQVIGQENCPGTRYRYTYTVTDDCGRTASATRDFIIGNEGPTIECPPFNLILECGDPNNQDYIDQHLEQISVNTSCELGYTVSHFPSFFNLTACGSSTVVTFVATDDCGRSVTCSTTVAIQDNTGPAISSTYVPDVCNEAICGSDLNFWYDEWKEKVFDNLTAVDDCFSPIFWSTIPNSPSPNQNCPDEIAETVVQFVATDQCGNSSYVEYSFYVVPAEGPGPAGHVSGLIATEESESVENVTVSLEGNGNLLTDVTEADGMYEFADLELEQNYSITPYLDENPLNGVSTFDIVLMSKHILEMDLLDSPYKLIAADINQSGTITTIDIVELRKLILFIDDEFQNNTSWRFVAADYVFPDPANPFAATFPEVTNINSLTPEEVHDFVGIKIGDLNGSVQANLLAEADDRTVTEDLVFGLKDQQLEAGQTYEVAFTAADFESIHGYQFSLNFDASKLSFEGVEAGALSDLSARNFGLSLLERGVLTTSWSSQQGVSVVDGSTVFSVSFTAKADGQLSELLQISSTYTAAEAYNQDLDLMGVDLRFDTDEVAAGEFRLYQNTPNPFKATTTIGFHLPKGGSTTLKVFDLSGRVLQVVEGDYDKGYNEVLVDHSDLSATGVLYYQLETADNQATRKMILLK